MGQMPAPVPGLECVEDCDLAGRDYRRLFFKDGRLVGACLIGDIKLQPKLIQLIQARRVIPARERGQILAG